MPDANEATPLERARAAAASGDWQAAYEGLTEDDALSPLGGADLPLLAGVAYATGHLDVTVESWERAYRAGVEAGDAVAAAGAAVRVAMHLLFDTALIAPVRGCGASRKWVRKILYSAPSVRAPSVQRRSSSDMLVR